jgi:hypothetical protein
LIAILTTLIQIRRDAMKQPKQIEAVQDSGMLLEEKASLPTPSTMPRLYMKSVVGGEQRFVELDPAAIGQVFEMGMARYAQTAPLLSRTSPSSLANAQQMVDQTPIRRVDPLQEKLQRRGVEQVLNGSAWLSSKAVGERADPEAKNKHALASRLLKQRRVFAIFRLGQLEFPSYLFDEVGQPYDAVREVLQVFDGLTPFGIAGWFESPSSMLGGRRPRELIATKPDAVIEAARAHMTGPVHG